ncbi:hypothetical protein L596_002386 [Steinernema carpocapsae]|uniref:Uncharacterized protein n=1 Tax=Steinernema carpocapsae TaxID=34508 RepID=A0A4U8UPD0_STECR|nr:hypothetical protein L596_002386 [Steinernema carpocapsae]
MLACSKGLEDTVRLLKPRPTFVTRPSVHPNEASVSFTPAATVVRKNATSKGEWVHFWRKMSSLRKHEA